MVINALPGGGGGGRSEVGGWSARRQVTMVTRQSMESGYTCNLERPWPGF